MLQQLDDPRSKRERTHILHVPVHCGSSFSSGWLERFFSESVEILRGTLIPAGVSGEGVQPRDQRARPSERVFEGEEKEKEWRESWGLTESELSFIFRIDFLITSALKTSLLSLKWRDRRKNEDLLTVKSHWFFDSLDFQWTFTLIHKLESLFTVKE